MSSGTDAKRVHCGACRAAFFVEADDRDGKTVEARFCSSCGVKLGERARPRYPEFTIIQGGEVETTVYEGGAWGDVWAIEIATDASRPRVSVREEYGVWLCHDEHKEGESCRPTQILWAGAMSPPFSFVVHEQKDRVFVIGLPEPPGVHGGSVLAFSAGGDIIKWQDRAKMILGILAGAKGFGVREEVISEILRVYCKDCGVERTLRPDGSRETCHCTNDE